MVGTRAKFEFGFCISYSEPGPTRLELRLHVRQHPADAGAKLVSSKINNSGTGNTSYSISKTNDTGAVGFMVSRGGLSIKSFKVSER